ncbi:MAG: ABC transporter permease [Gammaproteobacteria bacterium]|nr:ABC transporter permease [Gammaproteobacteria bacterium]MCY4219375.1 ABC transporter permease [Gammaproteobacteria bacterium]MCY4275985.1 ABC transporter permease [Gammaproteobacteria bacterium]
MNDVTVNLAKGASRRFQQITQFIAPISLLSLVSIATLLQPSFLSINNIQDILTQAAPLALVVLGQAFVILVRGLDLSVASLMASAAVLATAFNATSDAMIPVIFLVTIVASACVGLINGLLVTKRNVSPFLATLAMMIVLQGIRFYYTQGAPSGSLPEGFRVLGAGRLTGIPVNMLVFFLFFFILGWLLHKSSFGRRVYITGGNPKSANLVGIYADRVIIICYVISSLMAGISGLILVGFVGTVDNWVGRGYEIDSIVACVLGGIMLNGGKGTLWGAVTGALILILMFNIVIILGLPVQAQLIIKGIIIIFVAGLFSRSIQT